MKTKNTKEREERIKVNQNKRKNLQAIRKKQREETIKVRQEERKKVQETNKKEREVKQAERKIENQKTLEGVLKNINKIKTDFKKNLEEANKLVKQGIENNQKDIEESIKTINELQAKNNKSENKLKSEKVNKPKVKQQPNAIPKAPNQIVNEPPKTEPEVPNKVVNEPPKTEPEVPNKVVNEPPKTEPEVPNKVVNEPPKTEPEVPNQIVNEPPKTEPEVPNKVVNEPNIGVTTTQDNDDFNKVINNLNPNDPNKPANEKNTTTVQIEKLEAKEITVPTIEQLQVKSITIPEVQKVQEVKPQTLPPITKVELENTQAQYDIEESPQKTQYASIISPPDGMAKDSISFGEQAQQIASETPGVDEITAVIRTEILEKQHALLVSEVAGATSSEEEKAKIGEMKPNQLREYLASEEGREVAAKVLNDKELHKKLNEIETLGYKEVHTRFQASFKNVEWAQGEEGVRSTQIKNEQGQLVADIKETTHNTEPKTLTLEDGTTKTISSYRTIDFPTNLDEGKGPLHMSMAVKDENGKNIAANDAVYFTAHYNDKGNLTEVSSPQPVKFIGDGPDAVGYIEREGKVYTLPVTREKYQTMMQEVDKNQGMGVDLSQKIEEIQQDKFQTKGIEGKEKEKDPQLSQKDNKLTESIIQSKTEKTIDLNNKNQPELVGKGSPRKKLKKKKLSKKSKGEVNKEPSELDKKGIMGANLPQVTEEKQKEKELQKAEPQKTKEEPQKTQTIDLNKFVPSKDTKKDLEQIDKALNGKKPEEVSKLLKEQVWRGNSEVVGLIVEATKPSREGGPKETPKLEQKDFLVAYKGGMQSAPIGNKMQKIHETCHKLIKEAGVSPESHVNKVQENVGKHKVLEQRKGR